MCRSDRLHHVQAVRGDGADLETLLAALNDRRARVARAACEALAERFVVPRERLWKLLATTRWPHTRVRAVRLFARGERIDSMVWLLSAAALGDEAVREQACRYLAQWADTWAPVTPARLAELGVALRRAAPVLPAELAERLWAYVRSGGGDAPPAPRPARAVSAPVARTKPAFVRAPEPPAAPQYVLLSGRVLRRSYELTPRWRAPWKWRLPL